MISPFTLAEFDVSPQVIIALLFLLFSGLKWLFDKSKKGADSQESSGLEDIYEQYREEIRKRQTTVQQSPKPQQPARTQIVIKPSSSPPPLPATSPKPLVSTPAKDYSVSAYTQEHRTTKPQLTKAEREALARLQSKGAATVQKVRQRHSSSKSRYSSLLSSPTSARDAIVLSEILGPPKATR